VRRRFKPEPVEEIKEKVLDVDASMQGTLSFNDPVNLRINGKFEGRLNTKGSLMIGEHANVVADIFGERISIAGKVRGNVKAEKEISLIAPATVMGNIDTPALNVSNGAVINGNIKMGGSSSGHESRKKMLSVDEVAKYLEIEKDIVSEWADNGRLPGIKEGNSWKFDRSVLERWVSNEKIN